MLHEEPSAEVKDSLLYRFCGSEDAYRSMKADIEARRRRDAQRHLPASSYGDVPALHDSGTMATLSDLARFDTLLRTYPNEVRALLVAVVLDILDEYHRGTNGLAE